MAKFEVHIDSKEALDTYVKEYGLNLKEHFCFDDYGEEVFVLGEKIIVDRDDVEDCYEYTEVIGTDFTIFHNEKELCKFFYDYSYDYNDNLQYCCDSIVKEFKFDNKEKLKVFIVAETIEELIEIIGQGCEHSDKTFWYNLLTTENDEDVLYCLKFRDSIIEVICEKENIEEDNFKIKTKILLNSNNIFDYSNSYYGAYEDSEYIIVCVILSEMEEKGLI